MPSPMRLYPFIEVAAAAEAATKKGFTIFQQFNCSHCGTKQTMGEANKFFSYGICEECNKDTDIEKAGCNYMAVLSMGGNDA